MKTPLPPSPQRSLLSRLKKPATICLVSLVIVLVGVLLLVYNSVATHWYSAYENPMVTVTTDVNAKNPTTAPLKTFHLIENDVKTLRGVNDPYIELNRASVQSQLSEYKKLLINLNEARGMDISFIAMVHSRLDMSDKGFKDAVVQSQDEAYKILIRENFDIVACEGSWSDPLNQNSLVDENIVGLEEFNLKDAASWAEVNEKVQADRSNRCHLRYQDTTPGALLIGLEDQYVYFLNDKILSVINTPELQRGLSFNVLGFYHECEKHLIWFRTELAVAKTAAAMKRKGLKRGVIIMGQNHRQQFEVMSRVIGLSGQIYHTVPQQFRSDDSF